MTRLHPLVFGDRTVDLRRRAVRTPHGVVALTTKEAELLAWLSDRPGETVTREVLLANVWGYDPDLATRTVDTTIKTLRKKIEPEPSSPRFVLTVHGAGYRFEPDPVQAREPAFEPPVLVGREPACTELSAAIDAGRSAVVLWGPPGFGKTALLRWFAERTGAAWADARACQTPAALRDLVAGALSAAGAQPPAPRWVCIDGPDLVPGLADALVALRRDPTLRVAVATRGRLALAQATGLRVGPLSAAAAAELFASLAETMGEPRPTPNDAAAIAGLVGGMPLAITLAAERLPSLGTAGLLRRLAREGLLDGPDGPLASAFAATQRALDDSAATAWGVLPGEAPIEVAEAVLGGHDALVRIERAVEAGLLVRATGAHTGEVTVSVAPAFRALLRAEALGSPSWAVWQLRRWTALAERAEASAAAFDGPDTALALSRFAEDRDALWQALGETLDAQPELALRLVAAMPSAVVRGSRWPDEEARLEAVRALAAQASPELAAPALLAVALVRRNRGAPDEARPVFLEAFARAQSAGDSVRMARVENMLAEIDKSAGDLDAAARWLADGLARCGPALDAKVHTRLLLSRGSLWHTRLEIEKALADAETALALAEARGLPLLTERGLWDVANCNLAIGRVAAARRAAARLLLPGASANPSLRCLLAELDLAEGKDEAAAQGFQACLDALRDVPHPPYAWRVSAGLLAVALHAARDPRALDAYYAAVDAPARAQHERVPRAIFWCFLALYAAETHDPERLEEAVSRSADCEETTPARAAVSDLVLAVREEARGRAGAVAAVLGSDKWGYVADREAIVRLADRLARRLHIPSPTLAGP